MVFIFVLVPITNAIPSKGVENLLSNLCGTLGGMNIMMHGEIIFIFLPIVTRHFSFRE